MVTKSRKHTKRSISKVLGANYGFPTSLTAKEVELLIHLKDVEAYEAGTCADVTICLDCGHVVADQDDDEFCVTDVHTNPKCSKYEALAEEDMGDGDVRVVTQRFLDACTKTLMRFKKAKKGATVTNSE